LKYVEEPQNGDHYIREQMKQYDFQKK